MSGFSLGIGMQQSAAGSGGTKPLVGFAGCVYGVLIGLFEVLDGVRLRIVSVGIFLGFQRPEVQYKA